MEISEFAFGLSLDDSKFLKSLEALRKFIEENLISPLNSDSTFSDLSQSIADGLKSDIPEIKVAAKTIGAFLGLVILEEMTIGLGKLGIEEILEKFQEKFPEISKNISKFFEGTPTDIERLKALRKETEGFLGVAAQAKNEVQVSGEIPNSFTESGFPRNLDFIQERIDKSRAIIEEINLLIADIESGIPKISAAKPENTIDPIGLENILKIIELGKKGNPNINKLEEELNNLSEEVNKNLNERSQIIPKVNDATAALNATQSTSSTANQQNVESIKQNNAELSKQKEIVELTDEELLNLAASGTAYAGSVDTMSDASVGFVGNVIKLKDDGIVPLGENVEKTGEQVAQAEKTLDNIGGTTKNLTKETRNLDKEVKENAESIEVYEENIVKADSAAEQFGENGLPAIAEGAEEVSKALSDIDIQNLINDLSVEDIAELLNISEEDAKRIQEQLSKGFAAGAKDAKGELDALGVFTADIAANINDTFADLISNGLQGNFDNLGDIWDATLDSMLDSIAQLAATILSNPIRVFLEGVLKGNSTSTSTNVGNGQNGQNGQSADPGLTTQTKIGAGLILGGAAISAIGGAIENNIASSIVGGIGQTVSFAGAGFAAFGAIGAVIGAIIGLVTSLVSVISEATKKTPRLDLDFDQFRDDVGQSTGEAAKVLDFLDKDLFSNEIFNRSVSRQAGLGLGSELPNVIREAIEGQINEQKSQSVIYLDDFREKGEQFRLAA